MVIIGIDAHKRSHTAVIADTVGRQIAVKTIGTTSNDHLALLAWANKHDDQERLWAIEDCRHLSRRLESDLLAAGEQVVRVPPKLMSHVRDSARTFGKSDPIDALSIARAALREPDLPVARLDGAEREIRLLVDHREDLVAERTRVISRLRWHTCTSSILHGLARPTSTGSARLHASNSTLTASPGSSPTLLSGSSPICTASPRISMHSQPNSAAGSQSSPLHCWRLSAAGL